MKMPIVRKQRLAAAGLLLALALAIAGELLFDSTSSLALSLKPAGGLALAASLAAAILAAWLAPARSDAPGLRPPLSTPPLPIHPPDLPQAAASASSRSQTTPWVGSTIDQGGVSRHAWLRPAGIGLAIAFVAVAQFLFADKLAPQLTNGQRLAAGSLATFLGMVLFGLSAVRPDPALSTFGRRIRGLLPVAPVLTNRWSLAWLAIGLGGYAFAMGRFEGGGENRAVVWAWLIGIAALLISQWSPGSRPSLRILPAERAYLLALAGLLALALLMRTYRLTTLPLDLDGDFASHGLQARALANGQETFLFKFGWANIPMIGFLPAALTMKVFGTGLVGLNAAGVIEGLGIILGVYLLGRQLAHPRVGLAAAALLTISYTHLHFTRTSEYIDPVFFMVYAVYFLVLGLQRGRGWAFVLSGLCATFSLQMYYSGRITLFIIACVGLYLLIARRDLLAARWQGGILWICAMLVGLGPMLIVFLRDWEDFVSRSREVYLFTPAVMEHLRNKYQVDSLGGVLWEQTKRTFLVFHSYADTSTQFGLQKPLLDPVSSALLALGVGYAFAHMRRFGHFLLLVWLGLILVLGLFLTNNAPFWPRLLGLLPPAALLAGLALERLYTPAVDWAKQRQVSWVRPALIVLFLAGFVAVGVSNWTSYVESKGNWAMTRTRIGRMLADTSPQTSAYLVRDPFGHDDREFEFLAPTRFLDDLSEETARTGSIPLSAAGPTLMVLTPNHVALLDVLQLRFPDGVARAFPDNDPGSIGFYVFTIPAKP